MTQDNAMDPSLDNTNESIDILRSTSIEQSEVILRLMQHQDALQRRIETLEAMQDLKGLSDITLETMI